MCWFCVVAELGLWHRAGLTGEDGVEAQRVLQVFVHKKGLGHGGGVRQARRLDQDVVKPGE